MTVAEQLRLGVRTLSKHSDSPRLDAELLLGEVLGWSRATLIARDDAVLHADDERAFAAMLEQRSAGTPVAYLTGTREFWSMTLRVSPDVLVPRPETELLVEHALRCRHSPHGAHSTHGDHTTHHRHARHPDHAGRTHAAREVCSVLDLGTGSGAVALALAAERPHWNITAVDISPAALRVARRNAMALSIANIDWRLGSWFEAVPAGRFDLIVSNPPYIASGDPALGALRFEPALALTSGPTGLEALAAIISRAAEHLHPGGWLALEHGWNQASAVAELLTREHFAEIRAVEDLSGKSRLTLATFHTPR